GRSTTVLFITRRHWQRQAFRGVPFPSNPRLAPGASGNHINAGGLDHRRALLTRGEAICFVFIGVDAAKLFTVGVINGDEKMMMFAPFVLVEICSLFIA